MHFWYNSHTDNNTKVAPDWAFKNCMTAVIASPLLRSVTLYLIPKLFLLWMILWIIILAIPLQMHTLHSNINTDIRNVYKEVKLKMWVLVLISKVWNVNSSAWIYLTFFLVFPYLAAHFTQCYSCLHLLHVIQAECSWNCFLGQILHCDKACGEVFERPSVWDQHSWSGSC